MLSALAAYPALANSSHVQAGLIKKRHSPLTVTRTAAFRNKPERVRDAWQWINNPMIRQPWPFAIVVKSVKLLLPRILRHLISKGKTQSRKLSFLAKNEAI